MSNTNAQNDSSASEDMQAHVVERGQHFDGLCAERGADPDEVWSHAANDAIREQRSNRDVLAVGDVVYLPAPIERAVAIRSETTNRYRAHLPTVPVQTQLLVGNEPLANEGYVVAGTEPPIEGSTDGDGRVDFEVPATRRDVTLVMAGGRRFRLRLGELEPPDTEAGVRERLVNLGYLLSIPGDAPQSRAVRDQELAGALRRFQAAHDLEETGEVDDATRTALVDSHGV